MPSELASSLAGQVVTVEVIPDEVFSEETAGTRRLDASDYALLIAIGPDGIYWGRT